MTQPLGSSQGAAYYPSLHLGGAPPLTTATTENSNTPRRFTLQRALSTLLQRVVSFIANLAQIVFACLSQCCYPCKNKSNLSHDTTIVTQEEIENLTPANPISPYALRDGFDELPFPLSPHNSDEDAAAGASCHLILPRGAKSMRAPTAAPPSAPLIFRSSTCRNNFNRQSFQLLFSFLEGPIGRRYVQVVRDRGAVDVAPPFYSNRYPHLTFTIEKQSISKTAEPGDQGLIYREGTPYHYLIQARGNRTLETWIYLEENGTISSGSKQLFDGSLNALSFSSCPINSLINGFLDDLAIRIENDHLCVHRTAIQERPRFLLDLLFSPGAEDLRSNLQVTFLNDSLEHEVAVDAGGLRNQCLALLGRSLFGETASKIVTMSVVHHVDPQTGLESIEHRLPICITELTPENKLALENIGKFLTLCQSNANYLTEHLLSDLFFSLLRQARQTQQITLDAYHPLTTEPFSTQTAEPSPTQILAAHVQLNAIKPEDSWIHRFYLQGGTLTEDQKSALVYRLSFFNSIEEFNGLTPTAARARVKEELVELWRPYYRAAWGIAQGLPRHLSAFTNTNTTIRSLSESIQGPAFNREYIISHILYTDGDPVVTMKTAWLKELVRSEPQAWVENFLYFLTGSRNPSLETRPLNIMDQPDATQVLCRLSTCGRIIFLPTTHTAVGSPNIEEAYRLSNREKFINNLFLSLIDEGFGRE